MSMTVHAVKMVHLVKPNAMHARSTTWSITTVDLTMFGLQEPDEESDVSAPEVVPHHRSAMRAPHHRLKHPRSYPPHQPTVFYDPPMHPMHHKGHRGPHLKGPYVDHYEEAAMRMVG